MSAPTLLGRDEIFWTALEAIGTTLAFFLTFMLLLQDKIRELLFSPKITAINGGLFFTFKNYEESELEIEWFALNKSLFNFFGADIHGLTTVYSLQTISERKSPFYSGEITEPNLILPKNGEVYQYQSFPRKTFSAGKYELILLFESKGRIVGRKTFHLKYEPNK